MAAYRSLLSFRHSKIFKAYATSILGVISGLLTQFVFIRELTRSVSPTEFSLYAFVFQTVGYLSIFQMGMDFSISREIAIGLSLKNYDLVNYSYSFIKRFNRGGVIISSFCTVVLALLAFLGFIIPADYNSNIAAILILLFGGFQILSFLLRPNTSVLIGSNHQNIVNVNNVLINISSTLLAYILIKVGVGLFAMPLALIFWNLINLVILKGSVRKKCPWLLEEKQASRKSLDKAFFRYGFKSALGGLAWTIEATADVIILNSIGLMNLVGIYVIWWRFPQMLFDLATRLTTSAYPSIAEAAGTANTRNVTLLSKLILIISGIGFTVSVGIIFWLPSLINVWVGQKYFYSHFESLSCLIALLVFLRVIGNCMGMFLVAVGKVNVSSTLSWIQALIKIVLGILLAKKYQIEGLIISSIVCSAIQVLGLSIYLKGKEFLSPRLVFFITTTILLLIVASLFVSVGFSSSFLNVALGAIFTGFVAILIWATLGYLFGYRSLFFSRAYIYGRADRLQ